MWNITTQVLLCTIGDTSKEQPWSSPKHRWPPIPQVLPDWASLRLNNMVRRTSHRSQSNRRHEARLSAPRLRDCLGAQDIMTLGTDWSCQLWTLGRNKHKRLKTTWLNLWGEGVSGVKTVMPKGLSQNGMYLKIIKRNVYKYINICF